MGEHEDAETQSFKSIDFYPDFEIDFLLDFEAVGRRQMCRSIILI